MVDLFRLNVHGLTPVPRKGMVMTQTDLVTNHQVGEIVTEGKTKVVFGVIDRPDLAMLVSKDDITAGDGAKHDVLDGKGNFANQTTCNVFRLLSACGLPVAFIGQNGPKLFRCYPLQNAPV